MLVTSFLYVMIDPLDTGTGFATFNTQIDGGKYGELFAATETPVEVTVENETEEPESIISQITQNQKNNLHPQANISVKSCTVASASGAVAGDNLTVDVARLNVTANPCIVLDVFNITFDCKGQLINGTDSANTGIVVSNNSITIKRCHFTNFGTNAKAIELNGVNNTLIVNNTFSNSKVGRAITETGSQINVSIFRNKFRRYNASQLIRFAFDSNVDIINNSFYSGTDGAAQPSRIFIFGVPNSTIQGNLINMTIDITNSNNALIDNNTWGDRDVGGLVFNAILASTCNNLTITNNKDIGMSFELGTISNSTITDNYFENNGRIKIYSSSVGNSIQRNRFDPVSVSGGRSAGVLIEDPTLFQGNILANGVMNSVLVSGDNSTVRDNLIENVSGDAFVVTGNNNNFTNNTVYNFTGDAFRINGTNNRFYENNITYVIKNANTSFNPNVSTPQVPTQFAAFVLEPTANLTNISHNTVTSLNPQNLLNGLWGIRTKGTTYNVTIYNNTFSKVRTAVWMLDSFGASVNNNTITDCEQRAITIQNTTATAVSGNTITAPSAGASTNIYEYAVGLYVYRSNSGVFSDNEIRDYNIGIYVNNGSNNAFSGGLIRKTDGSGIGILSLYGILNNFSQIDIQSENVAVKALYTNFSNFTGVNATSGVTNGYQFFQSYNNSVQKTQFAAGPGMNVAIEFSHFSANNTINNNAFGGAADVDCLFDLFAEDNIGAGNGAPTQREENGASGNVIA